MSSLFPVIVLQSGDVASEAVIAGKGVGSSQGSERFEARDWGVLMCIYHNVPLLDYVSSAPDPQFFVSQNTDLPIPELDSIGMQSIPISMYSNGNNELVTGFSSADYTMGYLPSVAASFDVLALRRGEALQRWKEISLNVPQNYRAQIKAHFGVDVGENMSGMSTYIGGDSSSLDISEVVNTNLQSGDGL